MREPATDVPVGEDRYRPLFAVGSWSATLEKIWRATYRDDYPESEPMGFSTVGELTELQRWLAIGPGETFVDIGCGRGGPGLWLAHNTDAAVTGIDLIPEAVADAARRAHTRYPNVQARYLVGDFTRTGLPSTAFQGAASIDSLWMVLDKPAAIAEVARLLVPGARWVLSTWEPSYLSHVRMFESGPWEVLTCHEPPDWYARQMLVYRRIIEERDALTAELGAAAAGVLISEAQQMSPTLDQYRRLLIAVRRV